MAEADVKTNAQAGQVDEAEQALNAGRVVIFPTETVYGIGVKVSGDTSSDELASIKRRDDNKPFAWLVSSSKALDHYGLRVPAWARVLADTYWPGPLTLVVSASAAVPKRWAGHERTIALRVPADPVAQELLRRVNAPIATSSANIQGRIPPRAPWHLAKSIRAAAACVVEGGLAPVGLPSTIVDCTGPSPKVLRVGSIGISQIGRACGIDATVAPSALSVGGGVTKQPLEVPLVTGGPVQRGFTWMPPDVAEGDDRPVATVQLVHGMIEFIDRYDAFARFLASRGYAVYGCDLPAHGDSVADPSEWGRLPMRGGANALVNNTLAVYRSVASRFFEVPHIIFAHSMGTFIIRALIGRTSSQGAAPDGAPLGACGIALSGTGGQSAGLSRIGRLLAHLIGVFKGADSPSSLLDNLSLGSYNKAFEPARTSCDWLATNTEDVDAYLDEPRDGFAFSLGGYAALTSLAGEVAGRASASRVPKELPLLFASGSQDPVGEMGEGVKRAANLYQAAGVRNVEVKLFEGDRHEILNEMNRDEVFAYLLDWFERVRAGREA